MVELLSETPEGRELLVSVFVLVTYCVLLSQKEKLLIQSALQGLQDPNVRVAVIAQRIALNVIVMIYIFLILVVLSYS